MVHVKSQRMRIPSTRIIAGVLISAALSNLALGQAADVEIEPGTGVSRDRKTLAPRIDKLREEKLLLSHTEVAEKLKHPTRPHVLLPPPNTTVLEGSALAKQARKSYIRVGWRYLCGKCEHWHTGLAGGYIIAAGGIATTCHHCMEPPEGMREGWLVAVDDAENAYAVTEILYADQKADTAVIRLSRCDLPALPLSTDVSPGDKAYLFSEPLENRGYFSSGIVNRFFWLDKENGSLSSREDVRSLRMNVSTEWAPGSSGAAVLDNFGNAIGHVSRISPIGDRVDSSKGSGPRVMITLHEAIPVRALKMLLETQAGGDK